MFLKPGQRGLLLGKTGSGKTQNALFQLQNAAVFPVIIFDTKIEDAFFALRDEANGVILEVCEDFDSFEALSKLPKKDMPDFILVRPPSAEVVDGDALDKYLQLVYRKFGSVFLYVDEVFNWHVGGKPLPGLMELLGRGRSKKKTVLMGNQRPSWISRSCFTESDHFYIHRLLDIRDKKTLDSVVPNYSVTANPPEYHFYHFDTSKHEIPQLYKPVPITESKPEQIYTRRWL